MNPIREEDFNPSSSSRSFDPIDDRLQDIAQLRIFAHEPANANVTKAAMEGLKKAQENARRLWDAGVLIVAGSDVSYPGVFQGEGLHRELRASS